MQSNEVYDISGATVSLSPQQSQRRPDGSGQAKRFSLTINGDERGSIEEDPSKVGVWVLRDTRNNFLRDLPTIGKNEIATRRRLCESSILLLAEGRLPLKLPRAALANRPDTAPRPAPRPAPKPQRPLSPEILSAIQERTRGRPTLTLGGLKG